LANYKFFSNVVGNRDTLHRQDRTITLFFRAVNLKLILANYKFFSNIVGNRDTLHRQDRTITLFFHAVNLKLNFFPPLLFAFLYTLTSGDIPCIVPTNCFMFIKFIMTNCKVVQCTLIFTDRFKLIKCALSLRF